MIPPDIIINGKDLPLYFIWEKGKAKALTRDMASQAIKRGAEFNGLMLGSDLSLYAATNREFELIGAERSSV